MKFGRFPPTSLRIQALSVTVTVLGNQKSVTLSDDFQQDFQYKKYFFGGKKLSL